MPQDTRARTRAIRDRMAAAGERYTQAAAALDAPFEPGLLSISERMQETGDSYAEAVAFLEDPANREMCDRCGWTYGMACPECPGCGCYTGRCTGWRHGEFDAGLDDDSGSYCAECGANSHYECTCDE
jgi:hypothetical protein